MSSVCDSFLPALENKSQKGRKERVLVAMSGGVDSSLAALLLHEKGYDVVGLTMKTWDYARSGGQEKEKGCCSLDAIHDARAVACSINAPHYVTDIREYFGKQVIDYFTESYLAGHTPNPCVMCNTSVKWDVLLAKADALACDWVATGHYARLKQTKDGRYFVARPKDKAKDQTYALWGVSQQALSRTLFPVADYTKAEIKALAQARGLHALATKPESYEICFIPTGDYRGFLKKQVKDLEKRIGAGDFVLSNGKVVGRHTGYCNYTIGQRRGLGIALGKPYYVVGIDADNNRVVLGNEEELKRNRMWVNGINWVKYEQLKEPVAAQVHIRYNDKQGIPAMLYPHQEGKDGQSGLGQGGGSLEVRFGMHATAVMPGQAAVFYQQDDLIGGGWIQMSDFLSINDLHT